MIFVTVGTGHFPFNRLIHAVDDLMSDGVITEEVYFQIGSSEMPKNGISKRFLDFEEMSERVRQSRIVIGHAGVGTVLLCRMLGKIPIVMSRDKKNNEHVDNHQKEFVEKIKETNYAIPVLNKEELRRAILDYSMIVGVESNPNSIYRDSLLAKYLVSCFENKIK